MTAHIKYNSGNLALLCNNCNTVIATGSKIPNLAQIEGLTTLWFCCAECANEYYKKHGNKFEYLCNIMEPENSKRTK